MASVALVPAEQRVLLPNVAWETYERLMEDHANCSAPRFTYDRGALEVVSFGSEHELPSGALWLAVHIIAATLAINTRGVGSMTYKRADLQRGVEADSSFYVRNEPRIRHKRDIDGLVDPPPDLVIEVDITLPRLDKLPIFAETGVPEVWCCDGRTVMTLALAGGAYLECACSLALPPVTSAVLTRFLAEHRVRRSTEWIRMVENWARAQPMSGGLGD